MRRFAPQEIETIRTMVAQGCSAIAVAARLGRPALAIRKKCVELGLRLRPLRIARQKRIVLSDDVVKMLESAGAMRGVTAQRIASLLLSRITADNLTDAILDDADERARRKKAKSNQQAKTERATAQGMEPMACG